MAGPGGRGREAGQGGIKQHLPDGVVIHAHFIVLGRGFVHDALALRIAQHQLDGPQIHPGRGVHHHPVHIPAAVPATAVAQAPTKARAVVVRIPRWMLGAAFAGRGTHLHHQFGLLGARGTLQAHLGQGRVGGHFNAGKAGLLRLGGQHLQPVGAGQGHALHAGVGLHLAGNGRRAGGTTGQKQRTGQGGCGECALEHGDPFLAPAGRVNCRGWFPG